MAAHAKLGPSAADRWLVCRASVAYTALLAGLGLITLGGSSVFADEGTAAHEVRQLCLETGVDADFFLGSKVTVNGADYEVTEAMCEALQPGIDWIREFTDSPYVEIRLDLSAILPGQFGTMDAGWIVGDTLYVSDLKYGMGEPVSPERNKQQMLYALGFWYFLGGPSVTKVVICIDQPRAGGMKFWECDFDTLLAFEAECKEAFDAIEGIGEADLMTSPAQFFQTWQHEFQPTTKGCRWCPARDPNAKTGYMGCEAHNRHMLAVFQNAFDDLDAEPHFPEPDTFDPATRAYIVTHAKQAEKWLAKMHSASLEAALMGNPDPGLKAVIGRRGDRYLTDEAQAEAILTGAIGDAAYKPRQLIGITDIEKAIKPGKKKQGHPEAWEALSKLVDQPEGKPILVPADDERAAITSIPDQFDDLD